MPMQPMLRQIIKKTRVWPVVAYLILAAYGIIDAAVYLQSPFSGRISILACIPKSQGQAVCSVTIFGFRKIYRRSFYPDEFKRAVYYDTFNRATMSDEIYDGITILTKSEKINFVFPFQRTYDFESVARQINRAFKGDSYPSIPILFIGFHRSLYKRAILLIVGLILLVRWSMSKKWQEGAPVEPVLKTRSAFINFAFSWWGFNLLARVIFYVPIAWIISPWWDTYNPADLLASACYCHMDLPACGLVSRVLPFNHLICLYPLLGFATLQALVQWKFLKSKINLSGWWVAAPTLAILPMAIGFLYHVDCTNCAILKDLLSGIGSYAFEAYLPATRPVLAGLLVYFLLVGAIQCLALRSRSPIAIGWALVPLINTVSLVGSYWLMRGLWNLPYPLIDRYFGWFLLLSVVIQDVISALYAAWLVRSKQLAGGLQLKPEAGDNEPSTNEHEA